MIVIPPEWVPPPSPDEKTRVILDLPVIEMEGPDAENTYVGGFSVDKLGDYKFIVYAEDAGGNFALSRDTVVTVKGLPPLFVELEHYLRTAYNPNVHRIPGFVKALFGNEKINAYITLNDGSVLRIGAQTKNGEVVEFQPNEISNPTMIVYTTERTIRGIIDSPVPIRAFQEALAKGDITYRGVGVKTKVKLGIVAVGVKIYSFVEGLFGM